MAHSFLDLKSIPLTDLQKILTISQTISQNLLNPEIQRNLKSPRVLAFAFFEASTRTKLSFQLASHRLGYQNIILENASSSITKGESPKDTLFNLAAMGIDGIVVRCNDDLDLQTLSAQISVPLINAGWGKRGHPTQALLDVLTLQQKLKHKLAGQKIVFIGDVVHSRVASSHFELLHQLGLQIGVLAPESWRPAKPSNLKIFADRDQALEWCNVAYVLRVQFERHDHQKNNFDSKNYFSQFGLTLEALNQANPSALVMHPGPINHGIEFEEKLLGDPRCLVYQQVRNGVSVREAVLSYVFGEF